LSRSIIWVIEMKMLVNNDYVKVIGTLKEKKRIYESLSFFIPSAPYTNAYKCGWDGYKRFFDWNKFPTGFLPYLGKKNIEFELEDRRKFQNNKFNEISFDDWCDLLSRIFGNKFNDNIARIQYNAWEIAKSKKFRNMNWNRGVFQYPVGSGKTGAIFLIARSFNVNTVIFLNKRDLLSQFEDEFNHFGFIPGVIAGSRRETEKKVSIGMVETLASLLKNKDKKIIEFLDKVNCVIIDECHFFNDATYYKIMRFMPNAYYRFGFSGTPFKRKDICDWYLRGWVGGLLDKITSEELMKKGILSSVIVNMFPVHEPVGLPRKGDYHEIYNIAIVENEVRNNLLVEKVIDRLKKGKHILILCLRVEHGRILQNKLWEKGIDVEYIHGQDDMDFRNKVRKDFRQGKNKVVITTTIFDQGIDIPKINCLVLAGGEKSEIKAIQRPGRGMRRKENNNELEVIDFYDHQQYYCEKHSEERLRIYENEGFKINLMED